MAALHLMINYKGRVRFPIAVAQCLGRLWGSTCLTYTYNRQMKMKMKMKVKKKKERKKESNEEG
jgi:hypothetical protein